MIKIGLLIKHRLKWRSKKLIKTVSLYAFFKFVFVLKLNRFKKKIEKGWFIFGLTVIMSEIFSINLTSLKKVMESEFYSRWYQKSSWIITKFPSILLNFWIIRCIHIWKVTIFLSVFIKSESILPNRPERNLFNIYPYWIYIFVYI